LFGFGYDAPTSDRSVLRIKIEGFAWAEAIGPKAPGSNQEVGVKINLFGGCVPGRVWSVDVDLDRYALIYPMRQRELSDQRDPIIVRQLKIGRQRKDNFPSNHRVFPALDKLGRIPQQRRIRECPRRADREEDFVVD